MEQKKNNKEEFSFLSRIIPGYIKYTKKEKLRKQIQINKSLIISNISIIRKKIQEIKSDNTIDYWPSLNSTDEELMYLESKIQSLNVGYSALFSTIKINDNLLSDLLLIDEKILQLVIGVAKIFETEIQDCSSIQAQLKLINSAIDKRYKFLKGSI